MTGPVSSYTFVAFDFETTGLSPHSERIIEVGAVKFKDGKILDTYSAFVNPGKPIPADASRVNGISDAMVADAQTEDVIIPQFMEFAGDAVLIAHNAKFDMSFLRNSLDRLNLPAPSNAIMDTQRLSKKAFPRNKSYALQNLMEVLGIPKNNAHRALDDAESCQRLFMKVCDSMSFMGDLDIAELVPHS